MRSRLLIIHSERFSSNDSALAALTDFMGIQPHFIHFSTFLSDGRAGEQGGKGEKICAAVSGDTLSRMLAVKQIENFRDFIGEKASFLFIYGLYPCKAINDAIRCVSRGVVKGLASLPAAPGSYEVKRDSEGICRQLAGLRVEPAKGSGDHAVDLTDGGGRVEVLISTGGHPCFVKVDTENCSIFIAATTKVADIRDRVSDQRCLKELFSGLFPPAMFVKHAFGQAAWHNKRSRACLTVDDPLLKRNYGFLNYVKLLDVMDTCSFTTSIAFIPWNFRRTNPDIADLFIRRGDRFSICIHGCDHTRNEFGSVDPAGLDSKVKTATRRMSEHMKRTGLAFDNVMVFPQGIFSARSMEVLKSNNYLAALNDEPFATDVERSLEIRSLLEPAVTVYGNFPLFVRRFPEEMVEAAMDLFWGRPALILAHHDFFKGGYRQVAESIDRINALDRDLEWSRVGEIVRRSYLTRQVVPGIVEVKTCTSHTIVENFSHSRIDYLVSKEEPDKASIASVRFRGRDMGYTFSEGKVRSSVRLEPGERGLLEIMYGDGCLDSGGRGQECRNSFAILSRRYLSEMRDNYISRSDFLLSVATKLKDLLLR